MEVVRELARLIAFPTVSNRPDAELAAHVARRCEDLGMQVEPFVDPDEPGKVSIIARIGPEESPGLTVSGHLDVVPTEGQPWSTDPFRLSERDGQVYGRGTADMKGFVAATLEALKRVELRALRRQLVLVWTHDEELGCLGSAKLVHAWRRAGRTLPSPCLIGEPTDFEVLHMHPGHVAFQVVVYGAAAHSSRPELGRNAITHAARVVIELEALRAELAGELHPRPGIDRPWVPLNVATISGGAAVNIVPDMCRIEVGYRPLPGMPAAAVFERARDRLAASGLLDPGEAEVQLVRVTPALDTPRGTTLEADLLRHASCADPGAASFATDGGNLAELGCQPLIFGPGSITVAHQADEHIGIADLVQAVDVVEEIVNRRCRA